jgi:hypothetical protein
MYDVNSIAQPPSSYRRGPTAFPRDVVITLDATPGGAAQHSEAKTAHRHDASDHPTRMALRTLPHRTVRVLCIGP